MFRGHGTIQGYPAGGRCGRILLSFFAAWLSMSYTPGAPPTTKIRVFMIHSYKSDSHWTVGTTSGLASWLTKRKIPFETKAYEYEDYRKQTVSRTQKAREKERIARDIATYKPDYVVVCDDEAMEDYLPGLYDFKIPIIFTGINATAQEVYGLAAHRDQVTGVFERYPIKESLLLLRDLTKGSVQTIDLITSKSKSSLAILREFRAYFASRPMGVRIGQILVLEKWEDWQKAIKDINGRADALWMLVPYLVKDHGGQIVSLKTMGDWLSKHIHIPSLSIVDVSLHMGVMASISVTPEALGEEAGKLIAANVRDQIPISELAPVYLDKGEIMINIKQTDQVGIVVPIEIVEYATVIKD